MDKILISGIGSEVWQRIQHIPARKATFSDGLQCFDGLLDGLFWLLHGLLDGLLGLLYGLLDGLYGLLYGLLDGLLV